MTDYGDRWVKTENGQNFADSIGYKEPPMGLDESVKGVLKQVSDLDGVGRVEKVLRFVD